MDGDIDKALKLINAYYPHVLDDNRQIYFRLRCRKFVEMIRQSTELLHGSTSKQSKSVNGHSTAVSDDDFEPEMDLDEQTNSADDWDKMETEEVDSGLKYQGLLDMTLNYGRELKYEFRNDHRRHVENAFRDIFSMFAYEDPRKSPTAHLLDQAGRVPVAEELNSAILGRPLPKSFLLGAMVCVLRGEQFHWANPPPPPSSVCTSKPKCLSAISAKKAAQGRSSTCATIS